MQDPQRTHPARSGPLAAEVGVADGLARGVVVEEHPDARAVVGLGHAELLAEVAQQLVGRTLAAVLGHSQHPLGGVEARPRWRSGCR